MPPAPAPMPPTDETKSDSEPKSETAIAESSETPSTNDTAKNDDDAKTDEPPKDEKPPEKIPVKLERFAILTPGGPLLIDVTVTMDGQSPTDLFAERIEKVLKAGDTDDDKKTTWAELAANEEFLKAENALNPTSANSRTRMWTEQHDLNRDKRIQSTEAASWLGRDAGQSVTALSLRTRRSYYPVPALGSRVWQLLDKTDDGQLSREELAVAPERFFTFDANDDRIITPRELAPLREQLADLGQPPPRTGRGEDRYAALHLKSPNEIDRVEYLLADLYAPRQPLSPSSFADLPHLFEQLDVDSDNRLDQFDLGKLFTVKPHLEVTISFDKPPEGSQRGDAKVEIKAHEPEVAIVAQPAPNRAVLASGKTRLTVSANDLAGPQPPTPVPYSGTPERNALRVMVHDDFDALFEALDTNADGRLGEREISTAPQRLLERDKNADGALAGDELPTSMIVAFMRSEPGNASSFYVPEDAATPRYTATDKPNWFAQADFNSDGDISRREFLGSLEQFNKLDVNHDSFISPDEAPAVDESKDRKGAIPTPSFDTSESSAKEESQSETPEDK
jgi:Ca2+-binding EF-hand superfamily protein